MAHSLHGMSGQSRIIACPGSVRMQKSIPNPTNDAAELGTAVHELGEFCYLRGIIAADCIGLEFNGFKVNEDMAAAAQMYLDYCHSVKRNFPNGKVYIESRVIISSIDPERLWGTSDFILIADNTLIVGDYKNGYGLVEVASDQYVHAHNATIKGNAQCMGYALGAMDTFELWGKIDHVITFIVQPNADHIDGPCRHHNYDMRQVNEWHKVYADTHVLSLREDAPLNAGSHCRYCNARGFCGERITSMMDLLKFDRSIAECNAEQLIAIMEETGAIKSALDAVYDRCVELARTGHKVPGKKLVKNIVRAKCTDPDALVAEAVEAGLDRDELFNQKLKGKTDIKKIVGQELADKYYVTPEAGVSLVGLNDKRPAIMADNKPSAAGRFTAVEGL